jgi:heme-degrading monooxygenase HmoA
VALSPFSRHFICQSTPVAKVPAASWKEKKMIGVLVRFRYDADFDEQRIRKVAEAAQGRFAGLPGLRSKAFTVDSEQKEALNFYVWESKAAAQEFFTPELVERVTVLYGTRPTVQFADVAALVENTPNA